MCTPENLLEMRRFEVDYGGFWQLVVCHNMAVQIHSVLTLIAHPQFCLRIYRLQLVAFTLYFIAFLVSCFQIFDRMLGSDQWMFFCLLSCLVCIISRVGLISKWLPHWIYYNYLPQTGSFSYIKTYRYSYTLLIVLETSILAVVSSEFKTT